MCLKFDNIQPHSFMMLSCCLYANFHAIFQCILKLLLYRKFFHLEPNSIWEQGAYSDHSKTEIFVQVFVWTKLIKSFREDNKQQLFDNGMLTKVLADFFCPKSSSTNQTLYIVCNPSIIEAYYTTVVTRRHLQSYYKSMEAFFASCLL